MSINSITFSNKNIEKEIVLSTITLGGEKYEIFAILKDSKGNCLPLPENFESKTLIKANRLIEALIASHKVNDLEKQIATTSIKKINYQGITLNNGKLLSHDFSIHSSIGSKLSDDVHNHFADLSTALNKPMSSIKAQDIWDHFEETLLSDYQSKNLHIPSPISVMPKQVSFKTSFNPKNFLNNKTDHQIGEDLCPPTDSEPSRSSYESENDETYQERVEPVKEKALNPYTGPLFISDPKDDINWPAPEKTLLYPDDEQILSVYPESFAKPNTSSSLDPISLNDHPFSKMDLSKKIELFERLVNWEKFNQLLTQEEFDIHYHLQKKFEAKKEFFDKKIIELYRQGINSFPLMASTFEKYLEHKLQSLKAKQFKMQAEIKRYAWEMRLSLFKNTSPTQDELFEFLTSLYKNPLFNLDLFYQCIYEEAVRDGLQISYHKNWGEIHVYDDFKRFAKAVIAYADTIVF